MVESDTLYRAGTSNAFNQDHNSYDTAGGYKAFKKLCNAIHIMYTASWCVCVHVLTVAFLVLSAGVSVHTDLSPISVYLVRNFLEVMLTAVAIVVKT